MVEGDLRCQFAQRRILTNKMDQSAGEKIKEKLHLVEIELSIVE